jgi:mRNA-degrading endonuclease RelE of RelBE toxin-antitoxin system
MREFFTELPRLQLEIMMNYATSKKFDKELKTLSTKFRSLPEDLESLKRLQIEVFHNSKVDNGSIFKIQGCCKNDLESYVIKKISCRSLKGCGCRSGIRITYIFNKRTNEITFMEIYFKADQATEDKNRLNEYIEEYIESKRK